MHFRQQWCGLAVGAWCGLLLCGFVTRAHAAEIVPLPRTVLALYDDTLAPDPAQTIIHRMAEMPLNYLGMKVEYRSVHQPLATENELHDVAAFLTWFPVGAHVADPEKYCAWLTTQLHAHRKIVWLENPGFFPQGTAAIAPACDVLLQTMGVRYRGEFADNPYFFAIDAKESAMVEFERALDFSEPLIYRHFENIAPTNHAHLVIHRTDLADSRSTLVVTGPHGGFAAESFVHYQPIGESHLQWRLNPFAFFESALALHGLPHPDPTTLNGQRLFFSHIDGDGIFNRSLMSPQEFAGEVIAREIVQRYANLPIGVSIITGYLDLSEYRNDRATTLYRTLFAAPNVEPAAHGYAHPLVWNKGTLALDIPDYTFDPVRETTGSIAQLHDLLATLQIDKPATLYFWTGNCRPTPEQLALLDTPAVLHINGGDSRMDREHDSVAFVAALGVRKGGHQQIFAGAANENIFTELWHGRFYGFRDIAQTFANTESPRRLKPIDLYYHYYSGERLASLTTLQNLYDDIRRQPIAPIRVSDYIRIAQDFYAATRARLPGGGFRITHPGNLRTVRFEQEPRNVDLARSRGVIGFDHAHDNLYVHLDENHTHDIFLTVHAPTHPWMRTANFFVTQWHADAHRVEFMKQGWGTGHLTIAGLPAHTRWQIPTNNFAEPPFATTDANGQLTLVFERMEGPAPSTAVVITRAAE